MDIVEDCATLLRWAAMTVGNDDPEFQVGSSLESRRQGNFAIYDYSRRMALERRGGAGSDLLTVMGNAVVMGEQLSERDLGFTGDMFVLAGIETTRTALADGMLELLQPPRAAQASGAARTAAWRNRGDFALDQSGRPHFARRHR